MPQAEHLNQITALKQHFEQLFPGKWATAGEKTRALLTGLPEIDGNLSRGLARQRITEWAGRTSSGKTTVLRAAIANWCASGLDVAYIDAGCRLLAADWAFVGQKADACAPGQEAGRFWVIRAACPEQARPASSSRDELYIADLLLRSGSFDVVVLDLGAGSPSSRMYARLTRSLAGSKAALIILKDDLSAPPGWGCHTRLSFRWAEDACCEPGINGPAMITPAVRLSIWRDGASKTTEVVLGSHVSNRLFTHPQVPDRRAPKA